MPMWRCPHCGTPQAETARCWVCRRSSTSCATCRHFRRSVAAQLGYCGLDRQRQPLTGDEIRGCWEGWAVGVDPQGATTTIGPARSVDDRRGPLEFVEVGAEAVDSAAAGHTITGDIATSTEPGWSLWGDPDR